MILKDAIAATIEGEVRDDEATIKKFSRDASAFEIAPRLVVAPKNADDVAAIVRAVAAAKKDDPTAALAPRSAGTDMTGGPLSSSVVIDFAAHMNAIGPLGKDSIAAEPGAFYRDVEKKTLEKGLVFPSYPASKDLCAIGGIVGNDAGGELTLSYGKTAQYVRELEVVLSDGSKATLRPLSMRELDGKKSLQTLEGEIYRRVHSLLEKNADDIEAARPRVSKNSAGYALWDVWDKERGTFDLTRLITGSQGTLAIITRATLGLVKPKGNHALVVILLSDLAILPEVVQRVLAKKPESFESYDDHTFRLAVRFLPALIGSLGLLKTIRLGISFLPEIWMVMTGGIPKLVLLAQFAEDTKAEAERAADAAVRALSGLPLYVRRAQDDTEAEKYWIIRRQSFSLLRKTRGLHATPFIEDFVVPPSSYPQFLPALYKILDQYKIIYTIAGHIGNGNFHIIPLMNLADPAARRAVLELSDKVYRLVMHFGGTTTGEHSDGIIRTPYLPLVFGEKVCALFAEVKHIFDPSNIFNPGKKVGGSKHDIERFMLHARN